MESIGAMRKNRHQRQNLCVQQLAFAEPLERRRLFASSVFNGLEYPIGVGPIAAVSADFNGDGSADIATANQQSDTVSVLLNNGNATFAPAVNYPISEPPTQMFTADVNGDGHPDLIINTTKNDLIVMIDNANGSFNPPVVYAGYGGISIAVGDIDGDGRPDVISARAGFNQSQVVYNNGVGGFSAPVTFGDNTNYSGFSSFALGDVNHDGRLDVIGVPYASNTPNFEVFDNTQNRTFAAPVDFSVGLTGALTAVDLNGDGYADVVGFNQDSIEVAINNTAGGFNSALSYSTGFPQVNLQFNSVTISDVNGDHRPDLITSYSSGNDTLGVYLNNGNGGFVGVTNYPTGYSGNSIAAADFNGDGHTDLAVAAGSSLTVRLGLGTGNFSTGAYSTGFSANFYQFADLNNDGLTDLVSLSGDNVAVQLGMSGGGFGAAVDYAVPATPNAITIADFNNDGYQDIAVSIAGSVTVGGGEIAILLNKGTGLYAAPVIDTITGPGLASLRGLVAGDFNGDGKTDIAFFFQNSDSGAVIFNLGNGTFGGPSSYFYYPDIATSGVVGNFNADAINDLAVSVDNTLYVFMGRATGGFASAVTYSNAGVLQAGADLNGDGKTDLVLTTSAGATIWLNNGSGGFISGATYKPANSITNVFFADVNGDGKYDLLMNTGPSMLDVYTGNGDGTFQSDSTYDIGGQLVLPLPQSLHSSNQSSYTVVDANDQRIITLSRLAATSSYATAANGVVTVNTALAGSAVSLSQANGTIVISSANGSNSYVASTISSILINTSSGVSVVNLMSSLSPKIFLAAGSLPLTLNCYAGTFTVVNSGSTNLTLNDNANLLLSANQSSGFGVIRVAGLNISTGATVSLSTPAGRANRDLLVVGSLLATGTLDLGNNDMDLTGTSIGATFQNLTRGFNAGTWTCAGITSSTAALDSTHLTALGVIQNNQNGTPLFSSANLFDGIAPGAADVLIKYTYYGDANLDGKVDGSDYARIDAAFINHSQTGWFNGDFNYDGIVNGSDYTLIDNTFNRQGAALTATIAPSPAITAFVGSGDFFGAALKKRHRRVISAPPPILPDL